MLSSISGAVREGSLGQNDLNNLFSQLAVSTAGQAQVEAVKELAISIFGDHDAGNDLNAYAGKIATLTEERINSQVPLTAEEIQTINRLFFDTVLKEHLEQSPVANIISRLNQAVVSIRSEDPAFKMIPTGEGSDPFGGANQSYYLRNEEGKKIWVFKPIEGEKNGSTSRGIVPGTGATREKVASLLNSLYQEKFSVPYTTLLSVDGQIGSVQVYRPNCLPLTKMIVDKTDKLPADKFQNISFFDIIFSNTDRHLGNILCRPSSDGESVEVFAIDNGGAMTPLATDQLKMEYLVLPQMAQGFTKELRELINLNEPAKNRELMSRFGIEEDAIVWMEVASSLFKKAVELSDKESDGVEITASEFALFIQNERARLWEIRKNPADLEAHLTDILEAKKEINSLLIKQEIKQDTPLDDAITLFNAKLIRNTHLRRAKNNRASWIGNLTNFIVKPYIESIISKGV